MTFLQAFHLKPSNRTKCKFFSFTVLKLLYALTSSQKNINSKARNKKCWFNWSQPSWPCFECAWHRLVILPLPGGGGSRCSVKPASRCVLHSRNQVTQNLRSGHRVQFLACNGRDRYEPQHTRPSGALSTVQHFKALT